MRFDKDKHLPKVFCISARERKDRQAHASSLLHTEVHDMQERPRRHCRLRQKTRALSWHLLTTSPPLTPPGPAVGTPTPSLPLPHLICAQTHSSQFYTRDPSHMESLHPGTAPPKRWTLVCPEILWHLPEEWPNWEVDGFWMLLHKNKGP